MLGILIRQAPNCVDVLCMRAARAASAHALSVVLYRRCCSCVLTQGRGLLCLIVTPEGCS